MWKSDNDYSLQLITDDGTKAQQLSSYGAVILDTTVTPELEAEGLARDLIRAVQNARKEADLHVSDRIHLALAGSEEIIAAAKAHEAFIKSETLSENLTYSNVNNSENVSEISLQNHKISLGITRKKAAAA